MPWHSSVNRPQELMRRLSMSTAESRRLGAKRGLPGTKGKMMPKVCFPYSCQHAIKSLKSVANEMSS
jgi:hypothetical protein